jgi:hypothetical protein
MLSYPTHVFVHECVLGCRISVHLCVCVCVRERESQHLLENFLKLSNLVIFTRVPLAKVLT